MSEQYLERVRYIACIVIKNTVVQLITIRKEKIKKKVNQNRIEKRKNMLWRCVDLLLVYFIGITLS